MSIIHVHERVTLIYIFAHVKSSSHVGHSYHKLRMRNDLNANFDYQLYDHPTSQESPILLEVSCSKIQLKKVCLCRVRTAFMLWANECLYHKTNTFKTDYRLGRQMCYFNNSSNNNCCYDDTLPCGLIIRFD